MELTYKPEDDGLVTVSQANSYSSALEFTSRMMMLIRIPLLFTIIWSDKVTRREKIGR